VTISGGEPPKPGAVLHQLTSARTPWLALAPAGPARHDACSRTTTDVTVVDLADPRVPPLMVNPFEPEPGFPVQAHADRLAGLFEAAFGLPDQAGMVIRAGLGRAYAECGWDARTGAAPPGARTAPGIPALAQLTRATLAVAEDLGYDRRMRAEVRGFVRARLEPLWTGPAGRFLEGGHPADVGRLIRGNVVLLTDGGADEEGSRFLSGVLLARVAERLRLDGRRALGREDPPEPRPAVVTSPDLAPGAMTRPRAAEWFGRVLENIRVAGAEVIVAHEPGRAQPTQAGAPVLRGRRSAACGGQCRRRPCSGYELHAASLLAGDDERAWLRLWTQTLVLAFLAGRPLPRAPAEVLSGWRALSPRSGECILATVLDGTVTARAGALRPCYDPARLLSVVAAVAGRMLDETAAPFRAGPVWVIPQLRWLHELERLNPLGGTPARLDDIAPPLDFGLAGLPDWPGIRIRDRLSALERHPLSMASPRNRRLACTALLGENGRAGFDADLDAVTLGIHPDARLRHAARLMGIGPRGPEPGWLEVVLSWPDRIIHSDLRPTATG
jgi:hypothetical protein